MKYLKIKNILKGLRGYLLLLIKGLCDINA